MANLSSDFYGISKFINEIKKSFTDTVPEDTLQLGIYGYTGEVTSNILQNSIVMSSEFANESIPTKAKFEKNVIAHALGMGINGINATPARMDILLTIVEEDLIKQMKNDEFIFDKESPIFFNNIEFHLDYDISIKRAKLPNGEYTYNASYIIDIDNPVSDIKNPYLTSPQKMNVQGVSAIFTMCTIRQVEKESIFKKVLIDNTIEAKTVNFEFDSQLAAFTIDLTEGSSTIHLVPVYEGLTVEKSKYPYFYYTYLDMNTIRIKFDRNSYMPRSNSDIVINIQTTKGIDGNFEWASGNYPQFVFDSEKYGYSNLACEVRSVYNSSNYGTNRKSVDELKKIIPKESLSRGSITNISDIENFFNMLDSESSKMYFGKYRDNALERLYYAYILVKNGINCIIPTNTIDVLVDSTKLIKDQSLKETFQKGCIIAYNGVEGVIVDPENIPPEYSNYFLYTVPYTLIINTQPLYALYYVATMDMRKALDFTYINQRCFYQYISTTIKWNRAYLTETDTYKLKIDFEQNIRNDYNLIRDADGKIIGCTIRCVMVIYDENNNPLRWTEAKFVSYLDDKESGLNAYSYQFALTTKDHIDSNNKIRIEGLYDIGTKTESYAHLTAKSKAVIHIISTQDEAYGLNGLDSIVPDISASVHSLSNSYTVQDGLDFFYDYSEIISSTVIPEKVDDKITYHVKGVPVIKYNYFNTEDRVKEFMALLLERKNYIDYALNIIEDNFGVDFKFFNTYGPSKKFTLDNASSYINKVNLALTFRVKFKINYDPSIVEFIKSDIKRYIENINEINSLHMSNLTTSISKQYSESIVFFEFMDMNGYGPGEQHIYSMDAGNGKVIPEFLNVNTIEGDIPDINIIIL